MGMGPQMMHTEPRDMIRKEIIDKFGQGQGQPFLEALGGLSDDQCEALSKDQDKLNAWLASVQ